MQITRTSIFTGIKRTLEIDVTEEQIQAWRSGSDLIQTIMPHLTPDEREFLMTGTTSEEWDENMGEEE
jgi:hypothetical protein